MTLAPVPANTPQPVLQFTKLNIQIINSQFSNLVGTPYTLIFNDSLVEFINTTFTSNTGARPPAQGWLADEGLAAVTSGPGVIAALLHVSNSLIKPELTHEAGDLLQARRRASCTASAPSSPSPIARSRATTGGRRAS